MISVSLIAVLWYLTITRILPVDTNGDEVLVARMEGISIESLARERKLTNKVIGNA